MPPADEDNKDESLQHTQRDSAEALPQPLTVLETDHVPQLLVDWRPECKKDSKLVAKKGYVFQQLYRVEGLIGAGGFGQILQVKHVTTGARRAVKLSHRRRHKDTARMIHELSMLREAMEKRLPHFPRMFGSGVMDLPDKRDENDEQKKHPGYDYIIMSLLSKSLAELRGKDKRGHELQTMSVGSALRCGYQAMEALYFLHMTLGYVHRDIKPANMVFGGTEATKRQLYLIDFGLVRRIKIKGTEDDMLPRTGKKVGFRGTNRYASHNSMRHYEQWYKDDLRAVMYTMYELLNGDLPWALQLSLKEMLRLKRVYNKNMDKYSDVLLKKLDEPVKQEIMAVAKLIRGRDYERPKYAVILEHFRKAIELAGVKMDNPYDWEEVDQ